MIIIITRNFIVRCVDYRSGEAKTVQLVDGRVRVDRRLCQGW